VKLTGLDGDRRSTKYKEAQARLDAAIEALSGMPELERLRNRLLGCGAAHHREVFLGQKVLDDGARAATRMGTGCCDGSNFCPRCHIAAAGERVVRTLGICEAHLGTTSTPTLNSKLIADGLATEELVPIVMLFTATSPRIGGKSNWAADVERFEQIRKKFFHVMDPRYYWGKLKAKYQILAFMRATDVTYQLFGEMSGPHWHAHGLFFALIPKLQWDALCVDEKAKERFENEISETFHEEWQRAATNVDPKIVIQRPFRKQGQLKGGVAVELARDLNAASQYIAKNMAFEMAFHPGKVAQRDEKHTWAELIEIMALKDFDGKYLFGEEARAAARELYAFHASQGSRDQFTVGNIKGRVTIETYYCGSKEEREKNANEERLAKGLETQFTHSSSRAEYNAAPPVEVESSVDAYENGDDPEETSKVWHKDTRSQDEIKARIKDNQDYVQEKSAFSRMKKGCVTEKTLRRAAAWCERMRRISDEKLIGRRIKGYQGFENTD